MAAGLVVAGLAAEAGPRTLFSGLDLSIGPGDVVGLVGVNGAGKSTLLRLLAGLDTPAAGTVRVSPPSATVGYLPQLVERRPDESVRQLIARRTGVAAAQQALDATSEGLAATGITAEVAEAAADAYSDALDRWLALGAADLDDRTGAVLADLGLADEGMRDLPMAALSGGQAARVSLAALLLSRYDIVLLDEPTNDLDLDGLARLESFVQSLRAATIVVSHDREFLTRTVTDVVELDLAQQQVNVYGGGYAAYLAEREVARAQRRAAYEEFADTKAGLEQRGRTQRSWMEHGVRNARRKATDNDKIGRKFRAEATEKQAAKARQTDRMIERLDVVEEPRKEWQLQMSIAAAPRSGAVVATLRAAVVRRGSFTLGPIDAQVDWADRIAIEGRNGSGKTTLLAALLGRVALDGGAATLGPGVVLGEVDQARAAFEGEDSLLDAFRRHVPDDPPAEVRTLLAKFGLTSDHVLRPAVSLSAGERTRAALALLQASGVNTLVLDEPTNHLDLAAIEQLEQALASYDGTLLLVTHDRRMLDAVTVTRRWRLDAGRLTEG